MFGIVQLTLHVAERLNPMMMQLFLAANNFRTCRQLQYQLHQLFHYDY